MSILTFEEPSHCPQCQSRNISLGQKVYKKDVWGEDTDIVISGMWFCNECVNVLGRKLSQYENEIDRNSI